MIQIFTSTWCLFTQCSVRWKFKLTKADDAFGPIQLSVCHLVLQTVTVNSQTYKGLANSVHITSISLT